MLCRFNLSIRISSHLLPIFPILFMQIKSYVFLPVLAYALFIQKQLDGCKKSNTSPEKSPVFNQSLVFPRGSAMD